MTAKASGFATLGPSPIARLSPRAKIAALKKKFHKRKRALLLTHDNPDPDSLASAWALATIIAHNLSIPAQVAYGGVVGRAENAAFLRVLKVPAVPVGQVRFADFDLIGLVDTQQSVRNHAIPLDVTADIVIDHHPQRESPVKNAFADLGGKYGATATLLTEYLRAARAPISPELATALYYGIKADTRDLEREAQENDVACYVWLMPRVLRGHLAQIEHPELPSQYFKLYHLAIERAKRYSDGVLTDLGSVYSPDMVADVAERLSFLEGTRWSLALAYFGSQLYVSLRVRDRRMNAGRLMRETCADFGGSAGGHGSMAGARLPLPRQSSQRTRVREAVLKKLKEALGVVGERGVSLLAEGA